MKTTRQIGAHIGYLAARKGMTLSEISKIIGCTEIQTSKYLRGDAVLSYEQILALAKSFNTTANEIQFGVF